MFAAAVKQLRQLKKKNKGNKKEAGIGISLLEI